MASRGPAPTWAYTRSRARRTTTSSTPGWVPPPTTLARSSTPNRAFRPPSGSRPWPAHRRRGCWALSPPTASTGASCESCPSCPPCPVRTATTRRTWPFGRRTKGATCATIAPGRTGCGRSPARRRMTFTIGRRARSWILAPRRRNTCTSTRPSRTFGRRTSILPSPPALCRAARCSATPKAGPFTSAPTRAWGTGRTARRPCCSAAEAAPATIAPLWRPLCAPVSTAATGCRAATIPCSAWCRPGPMRCRSMSCATTSNRPATSSGWCCGPMALPRSARRSRGVR